MEMSKDVVNWLINYLGEDMHKEIVEWLVCNNPEIFEEFVRGRDSYSYRDKNVYHSDIYGKYKSVDIYGIIQIFRWIPPSTTLPRVNMTKGFWLADTVCTQRQWEAVMGNNPSRFTGDPQRPVEQVSWEDVQEFIKRMNTQEGGSKYRLPTEAEWEYAARAGSTTAYSFGDDPRQLGVYAWFDENAGGTTHPVGRQKKPNPWGLYDMHGNVWEWVQDLYDSTSGGSGRVIRGGSWQSGALFCRSTLRLLGPSGYRDSTLGFRIAMSEK